MVLGGLVINGGVMFMFFLRYCIELGFKILFIVRLFFSFSCFEILFLFYVVYSYKF